MPKDESYYKPLFKDSPSLCGQLCAFLSTGKGKELRGLYLDSRQNVARLLSLGREEIERRGLNTLGVQFMEGYFNEP